MFVECGIILEARIRQKQQYIVLDAGMMFHCSYIGCPAVTNVANVVSSILLMKPLPVCMNNSIVLQHPFLNGAVLTILWLRGPFVVG
jgi:hypothetical protein